MVYRTSTYKKFLFLTLIVVFFIGILTPFITQAQDATQYKLLEPLPGVTIADGSATSTASDYIPGIITLVIGIASVLAVLRIIFAGIKYMSTDAFQGKSEAKGDIQNAIWGLALAMSAWLILNTINPNLTKFNFDIPGLKQGSAIEGNLGDSIKDFEEGIAKTGTADELGCVDCEVVRVPHKNPPNGCLPPGPCAVNKDLGSKLQTLYNHLTAQTPTMGLLVTEAFPPTRSHKATCQQAYRSDSGMCVDAVISQRTLQDDPTSIKKFIDLATNIGLRATFEVSTQKQLDDFLKSEPTLGGKISYPGIKPTCGANQEGILTNGQYTNCCPPEVAANTNQTYSSPICSWITGNHFSIYLK